VFEIQFNNYNNKYIRTLQQIQLQANSAGFKVQSKSAAVRCDFWHSNFRLTSAPSIQRFVDSLSKSAATRERRYDSIAKRWSEWPTIKEPTLDACNEPLAEKNSNFQRDDEKPSASRRTEAKTFDLKKKENGAAIAETGHSRFMKISSNCRASFYWDT